MSDRTPREHSPAWRRLLAFEEIGVIVALGSGNVLGVPTSVLVMLAVGLVGHLILGDTAFGWRVQSIGSNAQAARFSGIPLDRYRVVSMTIMGLVASIAGVMELAFLQSGS